MAPDLGVDLRVDGLPVDGVRVEGFELRRLVVRVLVGVLRVLLVEGVRRAPVLFVGIRLVPDFEPVLGTRRYRSRSDVPVEGVLRVTGLIVYRTRTGRWVVCVGVRYRLVVLLVGMRVVELP